MNTKMITRFLGTLSLLECGFLLPSLLFALVDGDVAARRGILMTMLLLAVIGAALSLLGRGAKERFYAREGYFLVGLAWILLSVFGALPFFLSGVTPNFFDALFEAVSGFTTTGATILTDVASIGRALLFWRSLSNWIGGMGILVFLLAVANGTRGAGYNVHVLRAESPGPSVEKVVPRTRVHARTLYGIYIALTAVMFVILLLLRMPVFDALNCALATAGTGGFGVRADSMLSYSSGIQVTIGIFMFLFGINFNVHLLIIMGRVKSALKDEELRLYLLLALGAVALIFADIGRSFESISQALLHIGFTVSSYMTSTGFSTVDATQWTEFSKGILMILMLIGACAGSTGGGMKVSRIIILWKSLGRSLKKMLHPRAVQIVRINGKPLDDSIVDTTTIFAVSYAFIFVIASLILSLNNFGIESSISAVITCLSNIGPAFGTLGAAGNFSALSNLSKFTLCVCMLLGRLELFPYLVFLSPKSLNRAK